jgi:hypothetical protein
MCGPKRIVRQPAGEVGHVGVRLEQLGDKSGELSNGGTIDDPSSISPSALNRDARRTLSTER